MLVQRKPHVHIVIPKSNLLATSRNGKHRTLDPFPPRTKTLPNGVVVALDQQTRFIDAWQEHINNKFGFASPKDNLRVEFTGQSEMIGRYKGDLFETQRVDLRKTFLDEVLSRRIETWEAFNAMLNEHGTAREVRGKHATYMHFQPARGKGINLKQVFTPEFIALPTEEKIKRLAPEIENSYLTQSDAKRDPEYIAETLSEWFEIKSREIKYLNSGNRKFYAEYKAADDIYKRQMLDELESRFYNKLKEKQHDYTSGTHTFKYHINPPSYLRRERVRDLSECGMDGLEVRGEMLLSSDVRNELDDVPENKFRVLRRTTDESQTRGRGCLVGHALIEHCESTARNKSSKESRTQLIKRELDAHLLLDALAKSHGLLIEKYSVTQGNDGGDRILCGKQNLNVTDFLTREMNIAWADASKILSDIYATQMQLQPVARDGLWHTYQAARAKQTVELVKLRKEFAQGRLIAVDAHKRQFAELKAQQKVERGSLFIQYRTDATALAMKKMLLLKTQVDARTTLRDQQRAMLISQFTLPKILDYADWLDLQESTVAQEQALTEARKSKAQKNSALAAQETNIPMFIIAGVGFANRPQPDIRGFKAREDFTAKTVSFINISGAVGFVYDIQSDKFTVNMQRDPVAVLAALQIASSKFGKLTLTGDPEFQSLCVSLAAQHGFMFVDSNLNVAVDALRAEKRKVIARPTPSPQQRPPAAPLVQQVESLPITRKDTDSMATKDDHEQSAIATSKREANQAYTPNATELKAIDAVLVEQAGERLMREAYPNAVNVKPASQYTGKIIEVSTTHLIQSGGGTRPLIMHRLADLPVRVFKSDEMLDVNYPRDGGRAVENMKSGQESAR